MFTVIHDLKKLDKEVKAAINEGSYRLLPYSLDSKTPYVILIGDKAFLLDSDGAFVSDIPKDKIPPNSFSTNYAFKTHDFGSIKAI